MIAIVLLLAVIGVIVYSSRKARSDYVVSIASAKAGETWTFNVRDMSAELKAASTGVVIEACELRRDADGRWERAALDDDDLAERTWVPCEDSRALEEKYRRYNRVSER